MSDQTCWFCKKLGDSLLKCSACGSVAYCNTTCQKSDWRKHKKNCRSYKIEALPGKGFGMIAVRNICQGEPILKENPILLLSKDKKDRQTNPSLLEQFENLSESDQAKVLKLHHDNPDGKLHEKIQWIFEANTIEVTPANAVALYPMIPRINHSCSPNVVWSWQAGSPYTKQVRAVRSIAAGEELCANYIDSFEATFSSCSQRQVCLNHWKFVCQCEICSLPETERNANDLIRQKIALQHQLIPKYMANWKIEQAVAAARTKLELMMSIKNQMITTLPSALLELYEMCSLAKILNCEVPEDCDALIKQAKELSEKLGDRFVHVFNQKVQQVEQECREVERNKKQ
eukprot:GFUD01075493.1.p1 GENE.GFUD01075493.1~~GFUD01075493.1.p1  ORF type:complete len:344 (+),score=63.32 GFUD01075493.1:86-1117(+)